MTQESEAHAGAPFGAMLRGAFVPAAIAGVVTAAVLFFVRGADSLAGSALGLAVTLGFFGVGMFLLSTLVRSANPHAFFAVAMAVYLGQIIGLLVFLLVFRDAEWVDGRALGIVAFVVMVVWQVFAMKALRRARVPVYDLDNGPTP